MRNILDPKRFVIPAIFISVLWSGVFSHGAEEAFRVIAVITKEEVGGSLNEPSSLFFDEIKKRLYVADSLNNRLVSYDEDFVFLSELTDENFALPLSVVKTPEGGFLIVDGKSAEIKLIDVQNKAVRPFPLKDLRPGEERFLPGRLAIDKEGRLYAIDKLNKRIIVFDRDGNFLRALSVDRDDFYGFNDVKVDAAGYTYAVDTVGRAIYLFDGKGAFVSRFAGEDTLLFPVSIAPGKRESIYVLDRHTGTIFVFDKGGNFKRTLSKKGMARGELYSPSYIFTDSSGRLYTIDGARVQVFEEE